MPAVKHGDSKTLMYACLYTFIFNVLDMPTTSIPVDLVKQGDEVYLDQNYGKDYIGGFAMKTTADSIGCPIGIQVSCLPYEDEKLIGISKQFEAALKFPYLPLNCANQYKPTKKTA